MKIYKKCRTCGKLFTRQGDRGKGKFFCSYRCIRKSVETRKKMSDILIGNKRALGHEVSEEVKDKMRSKLIGRKMSDKTREKLSLIRKEEWENGTRKGGWKHSEEFKKRRSKEIKGENNPNWMGGISENPYPKEFNSELKFRIRKRDNFICCLCGKTEKEELKELNRVLCVNHINFDKNDCRENNLNTLCLRCNIKINNKRNYWINYFQINSKKLCVSEF